MSLEEAAENLEEVSRFLEVHAQTNRDDRTLRIHHELDIQVQRLQGVIQDSLSSDENIREELGDTLRQAIAETAETVDQTGDPYRVIDQIVRGLEDELDVEITEEERQSVRDLLDYDPLEGFDDYAGHSEVDLEGLPEEVQEQLEDIEFESGEELLGRFHLYLSNETELSPGDNVDYVREMDYQLGLNPDEYPAKRYTHNDELSSSARDKFSEFLDSSYAEDPDNASEEGETRQ